MRRTQARALTCCVVLLWVLAATACQPQRQTDPVAGRWYAWLDSPGGTLPFGLEIERNGVGYEGFVINGAERQKVPRVVVGPETVVLHFDQYDSAVSATLDPDGGRMDGEWRRTAGPDGEQSKLTFHAEKTDRPRFDPDGKAGDPALVSGRWAVDFETDSDPSVGIFKASVDGTAHGTFMNATGDYRFLAGDFRNGQLRLSTFDGAHAFLFHATIDPGGSMQGDFWSRDKWHETWTGRRDEHATLPDAFGLTSVQAGIELGDLAYPDLEGRTWALDAPEFTGDARLLVVFGTWCPNCNDCSEYLVELHDRYGDRGLAIQGLAFEMTGDFQRDAEQVRTYKRFHQIDYPVLIAGLSDKAEASTSFPLVDRVRSYPTILFLDRDNTIRAVHQGFAGPATGAAYDALRERFEVLIEELLS